MQKPEQKSIELIINQRSKMLRRLPFRSILQRINRPIMSFRFFSTFNEEEFKVKLVAASNSFNQQKFEEALKSFTELSNQASTAFGQDNKYWGVLKAQIANSLYKLQRFEESGQIWKELALHYDKYMEKEDISKLAEDQKVKIAYPWIPHGLCLFNLNKVDEAIQAIKRGLSQMEKAFGSNHSRVIEEYLRFGNMLQGHKRNELSVEYFQKYIEKKEFVLGPSDQKLMSVKLMAGSILSDIGRIEEGIRYYKEVIEAADNPEDPIHKNFKFTSKLLMATGYKHLKRKKESLALFEELNAQVDDILESSHINYVKIKCLYGLGLYDDGRQDQAFKLLKVGTDLSLKHHFDTTVECIMARHYYAQILQSLGYNEEGITHLKEVNQTILKNYGENSELYVKNLIDLSNSLIRAQKFDEAEKNLSYLKESLEKKGLRETQDYCKMMLNTCALHFTSGNPEPGKKVLNEFKELVDGNTELKAEFGTIIDQMYKRLEEIENK